MRSRPWYVLSSAGERKREAALPKALRDPVCRTPAICTGLSGGEGVGGRGGGEQGEEEEEQQEGSPNKRVPQRTLSGSDPAWALFQHRKLPAVGLGIVAAGFINSQQSERGKYVKGEVECVPGTGTGKRSKVDKC